MKIGLYFGSFNPIHIGHLAIAEYIIEYTDLQQLWFVVSPHNPLKTKKTLLDDYERLEMVHRSIGNDHRFHVSDIEFRMPKPSYTVDTLAYLEEKHPRQQFSIILGADNLMNFRKWKNCELLIRKYTRYVYPRHGVSEEDIKKHKNIIVVDAPKIEISSSFIRNSLKEGKTVKYFLPPSVYKYIDEMNFYR